MNTLRGFSRGGMAVHRTVPFDSRPIENAFLPKNAVILMRDSPWVPDARLAVGEGQEVREGQLLGRALSPGSSNVFSPIPGIVTRVSRIRVPGGYESDAVSISLQGAFSILGKKPERYLWKSLSKSDITHIMQEKGIVRVSDGQPLHEAARLFKDKETRALVVSALETDPYRRTEGELLAYRVDEVVDGCAMLARILEPRNVTFAVEAGFPPERLERLAKALADAGLEASVARFRRRHPQDFPGQLAEALGLPGPSGAFIVEPTTLVALHDAVASNKAHIEQFVFVGGGSLKRQAVLKARIGTPIGDLIEECGGFMRAPDRIVVDSPLTGSEVADLDAPVTKTTRAVLALSAEETRRAPERACVRCGACVRACPERLDPHMLGKLLRAGKADEAVARGVAACTGCGACAYACPSRIPLVELFDAARGKVGGQVHD